MPKISTEHPVTVIIPIYRGLSQTQNCVESVLRNTPAVATVMLVNDYSPEPALRDYCREVSATDSTIVLIENEENLGFVRSVNKAIAQAGAVDVVLLNSDTEVPAGWLQRLQRAAYTHKNIGTVTPFSNNATICSYPEFCAENDLPDALSVNDMQTVVQCANGGRVADIPTAVGFCMYIRQDCLVEIGSFDETAFGKGYGEENDFCLRASQAGWRHLLAADCFVYHEGGVSFQEEKTALVQQAENVIRERYPDYFRGIETFIQEDPIRPLRQRIGRCLLSLDSVSLQAAENLERILSSDKPRLLFISHGWGGGVEQHIDQLKRFENYHVICLKGQDKGGLTIELSPAGQPSASIQVAGFDEQHGQQWLSWVEALKLSRIHIHHLHGWSKSIVDFVLQLSVPIDITLHDYYLLSPNYHQSEGGPRCEDESWPQSDAPWQKVLAPLVRAAQRIIAPSRHLAQAVEAAYPFATVVERAHPERIIQHAAVKKVALVGALSPEKGLSVALEVSRLAEALAPNLVFELIGYPTTPLEGPLTIGGDYREEDLPRLLAASKADVIWFPAQVPESYSFTLSYAMATGLPILASDIGALPQRLADYPAAFVIEHQASPDSWLDVIKQAVDYQPAENSIYLDTLKSYCQWYCEPLPPVVEVSRSDMLPMLEFLHSLPDPQPIKDRPIKSLYAFAASTRHSGILKEVARRFQTVDDEETEIIGMERYRELHQQLQAGGNTTKELTETIRLYQEEVRELTEEKFRHLGNLETAKENMSKLQAQGKSAQAHIDHLEGELALMLGSISWKVTAPLRFTRRHFTSARIKGLLSKLLSFARTLGRHALRPASRARLYGWIRHRQWRTMIERIRFELRSQDSQERLSEQARENLADFERFVQTDEVLQPLHLMTSQAPVVSIVIPVYGEHVTTYQCLKSIAAHPPSQPYEVIIADDCSPQPAQEALAMVEGLHFYRAENNLGFVGNMNAGAAEAKGQYLVLLNNDTIICASAFDRLLATFDEHKDVGMVGAKLLNTDGSLQEAGGIIWRDGSGWNWGRGQQSDDPRFNYVRDVDYCSGAVLAIPRQLFTDMGGFDTRYMPAYYEDTDLAFRIRERGLRVLYQPAAAVFHIEGVSHGRDENTGVKAHQVSNAVKFVERWADVLAGHNANGVDPDNQCHRYTRGNILVIEACMITPDQDSGSVRMLNLLKILRDEGYHVTFIADNLEYRQKVVTQLNALGIEVLYNHWAGSVRRVLHRLGPSLQAVFISRHYIASPYAALVRALAPQAKLVFDTVDLHFVREEREAALGDNESLKAKAATTKRQELELIRTSDMTLVVSEFEKQLLSELVPEARVEIVSNIHSHTPDRPGYVQREGILFVGGFRHTPNVDAIEWYVNEVLPHLQTLLPGVVTTVIGSNMPDSIKALASDTVRMLGFVEDIEPELQTARVSIAPLRYGAGVKGKVNEAMNYAIPVVATHCAVEGMHTTSGEDVLVAETPEAFAEAITKLYTDPELWQRISSGGIKNLESHFSPDAVRPTIKRILA